MGAARVYHTTALGSSYHGAGVIMVRGGVSDDMRALAYYPTLRASYHGRGHHTRWITRGAHIIYRIVTFENWHGLGESDCLIKT